MGDANPRIVRSNWNRKVTIRQGNYPEAYWKTKNSGQMQFWDGYTGEETIIVDEFYGWLTFDFMLDVKDDVPTCMHAELAITEDEQFSS